MGEGVGFRGLDPQPLLLELELEVWALSPCRGHREDSLPASLKSGC